jgi:hypothetical protein
MEGGGERVGWVGVKILEGRALGKASGQPPAQHTPLQRAGVVIPSDRV